MFEYMYVIIYLFYLFTVKRQKWIVRCSPVCCSWLQQPCLESLWEASHRRLTASEELMFVNISLGSRLFEIGIPFGRNSTGVA